jgi:Flp pilus assembly protein TadG
VRKESIIMSRLTLRGPRTTAPGYLGHAERGQLLVVFALALVALIAMVGLIIDGGDTALQRRDQQNVADAAAMAAADAYVNDQDEVAAAHAVAAANGYVDGQDGTTVTVTSGSDSITVDVRDHRTTSGIVGFASWNVSTTASVVAACRTRPTDDAVIFNEDVQRSANRDP